MRTSAIEYGSTDSSKPSKAQIIAYKVTRGLLIFGFLSGGLSQLLRVDAQVATFEHLGYPLYVMSILGTLKILGGLTLLLPRYLLLKTAAHAGLLFVTIGAMVSHIATGDTANAIAPFIVAALTIGSFFLHLKHYGVSFDFPEKLAS